MHSRRTPQDKSKRVENSLQRAWRLYKEKAEYQTSAFPFQPRRKTLFDKLHDDFLAILTVIGLLGLILMLARYLIGW